MTFRTSYQRPLLPRPQPSHILLLPSFLVHFLTPPPPFSFSSFSHSFTLLPAIFSTSTSFPHFQLPFGIPPRVLGAPPWLFPLEVLGFFPWLFSLSRDFLCTFTVIPIELEYRIPLASPSCAPCKMDAVGGFGPFRPATSHLPRSTTEVGAATAALLCYLLYLRATPNWSCGRWRGLYLLRCWSIGTCAATHCVPPPRPWSFSWSCFCHVACCSAPAQDCAITAALPKLRRARRSWPPFHAFLHWRFAFR